MTKIIIYIYIYSIYKYVKCLLFFGGRTETKIK